MERPLDRCVLSLALILSSSCLASLAAPPSPARAGMIHPAVLSTLEDLQPAGQATVLVVLERQADVASIDADLKRLGATRAERHRRVVDALHSAARSSQPPVLAAVDELRARGEVAGYTPYWITNLVVVRGTRAAIEDLAAREDVAAIEPDLRPTLVERVGIGGDTTRLQDRGAEQGLRAINAPRVWDEMGINGSGAIVATLDTGVDGSHPALSTRWRGNNGHPWQECWLDVVGAASQFPADDGSGHGTHVTGTLVGAAGSDTIGVAWGAQWIAANAIAQGVGSEFDNDILRCLQWFADPDGDPGTVDDVPDVVLGAWGVSESLGYADCDARWWWAIDACEAAGVVLLWSAGGDGPGASTIRSPADRATTPTNSFSVGAVDAAHYAFPFPVTSFSSRGPSGCQAPEALRVKPEVVAPGVDVRSCVPGGGYSVWSGTAMASAHVAGVVALMRSANPDLDVDTIKAVLMQTARDSGPAGEDNAYGWGTIDAYAAVRAVAPGAAQDPLAAPAPRLFAGSPNPFSGSTSFRIRLAAECPFRVSIHDAAGRLVRTLPSTAVSAVEHVAVWDGTDASRRRVAPGIYFCRLRTPDGAWQEKTILLD